MAVDYGLGSSSALHVQANDQTTWTLQAPSIPKHFGVQGGFTYTTSSQWNLQSQFSYRGQTINWDTQFNDQLDEALSLSADLQQILNQQDHNVKGGMGLRWGW